MINSTEQSRKLFMYSETFQHNVWMDGSWFWPYRAYTRPVMASLCTEQPQAQCLAARSSTGNLEQAPWTLQTILLQPISCTLAYRRSRATRDATMVLFK
jgi:hypothetical protein